MLEPANDKSSEREDLQGLRGIAIMLVVMFQFFPDVFPNGYLGVDIIFVICGFLFCSHLERSSKTPPYLFILSAFASRLRRIVPLYLFVVLLTLLGIICFLPTSSFLNNREYALRAVSFFSNQPDVGDDDYFEKLSVATDFFTHTWSISVEIQFYLLIPFLYVDINKFESPETRLTLYGAVAALSYLFHIFSSPITSFYSVFSRIFQFTTGMMAYFLTPDSQRYQLVLEKRFNPDSLAPYKTSILGALLYISTYSNPLSPHFLRPMFTLSTGVLTTLSRNDKCLCNPFLRYIGDVSSAFYLVHWPFYAFWKFEMESGSIALIILLLFSMFLAILLHESFEKWSLKLNTGQVCVLIAVLFTINIVTIFKDELLSDNSWSTNEFDRNATLEDPARMNQVWNSKDWTALNLPGLNYWDGWNYRQDFPLEGTSKMLIVGSSTAANIVSLIQEECQQKAKSILQGTFAACEPLFPTSSGLNCSLRLDDFQDHFRREQPDYAFLAARHLDMGAPFPKKIAKLEHDPTFVFAREQLRIYAENTKKKLFILHPFPRVHPKNMDKIAQMVKENRKPEDIDRLIVDYTGYEMAKLRFERLVEDCGEKCAAIDFTKEFIEESTGSFRYFNFLGFSYFTENNHLTPFGLTRVRHLFRELCRSL